jgi:PAS domain S-box-containing protein
MASDRSDLVDAQTLRLVIEGTVSETGTEFFRALVKNLARATGTAGAWVTEYHSEEKRLNALAFWLNNSFVEDYTYDIAGTACARVIGEQCLYHVPDRVIDLYPDDRDMVELGAVSYLGVPLFDTEGSVMGHLAVLDTEPLKADERLISLFEIFAARAAAECRRLKAEHQLRASEEELNAVLGSAMDAIIVLDDSGTIIRVNPAAERLFGCLAEDLLGEDLREFLPSGGGSRFDAILNAIDTRPDGREQLWIPQDFIFQKWNRSTFPAEATVSRFCNRGQTRYTVILRNVDERLAAERRIELLAEETERLREDMGESPGIGGMLGSSQPMKQLFEAVRRVAGTDATVLVTGETGTGKELVARSIHQYSKRQDKPLVRVNCAAIPGTLIESEFFGHERGAFTGATTRREGRFALADGGTIFLDEVGELPIELQAKLLRVLQEGEFEPLGSARTQKVDVRVVAATNCDLARMVSDGKFREDLFYRLAVFPVKVPPLRERGNDVILLARAFVDRFARRMGRRMDPLHPDDLLRLQDYGWPGNVRELQNVIERAIILSRGRTANLPQALPLSPEQDSGELTKAAGTQPHILTVSELQDLERTNIRRALLECGGKISGENGAAARLGLAPSTLSSRMKALGVQRSS